MGVSVINPNLDLVGVFNPILDQKSTQFELLLLQFEFIQISYFLQLVIQLDNTNVLEYILNFV